MTLNKIGSQNDTLKVVDYYGPNEFGWKQQTVNFVMPENTLYFYLKITTKFVQSVNGTTRVFMDGIKLTPLQ